MKAIETLVASDQFIIWSFSIVGFLFLFFCFAIAIQRRTSKHTRYGVSSLFFVIGLFCFNEAGRILSGNDLRFTAAMIINLYLLALVGMAFVVYFYKHLKEKENDEN